MDLSCHAYSSTDYHEYHCIKGESSTSRINTDPVGEQSRINDSFANKNTLCINDNEMNFPNDAPPPFTGDSQLCAHQSSSPGRLDKSDFAQHNSFNCPLKLENHPQYAQLAQNMAKPFSPSDRSSSIHEEFSLLPVSGNSEQYNPATFLGGTLGSQHMDLSHLETVSPHRHPNIVSPTLLQSNLGTIHQSPVFGQPKFDPSPNNIRIGSIGSMNAGFTYRGSFESSLMQPQFQTHRKTPSENSDISVASAQQSPSTCQHNIVDRQNSPMQSAQDSSIYQDLLRIGNFSLSDPQIQNLQINSSPVRSPVISPRLDPQRISQEGSPFCSTKEMFDHSQQLFPLEPFPSLSSDMGQAQQMIPPEINVEFAPTSSLNIPESSRTNRFNQDALTPTDKVRPRALTDTTNTVSNATVRPRNSSCVSPQTSSGLAMYFLDPNRSLSPNPSTGGRKNSISRPRRQSTPSMPSRDYILSLADPEYQALTLESGSLRRAQKHPAIFQCTLCPKRFTRAYNLRSHLRTHTDERPFKCTVCSKAFARQHDRKRHESLHSGEKKFICKGELKMGGQWGCSHRFARADALGRHFRSEAGRICINPLLEEEARERQQRVWNETSMQSLQQTQQQIPQNSDCLTNNFRLPAVLLAQYPALATLSWPELMKGDSRFEDDPCGRNSLDAIGSEYYEEIDDTSYVQDKQSSK